MVFALPTHALIDEKLEEYSQFSSREFFRTLKRPTLPEPYESALQKYERALNFKERTEVFKKFKQNYNGDDRSEIIKNIIEYEQNYIDLPNHDLVMTTHSKLLCHPELSEKIKTVVVDENIFLKCITVEDISPNDLIYFSSKFSYTDSEEEDEKIFKLLESLRICRDGQVIILSDDDRKLLKKVFSTFSIDEIANSDNSIGCIKLTNSNFFTYSSYSRTYKSITINNLDKQYNYLILTADNLTNLIKSFVDSNDMVNNKLSTHDKQTVVKQFTKRSYSRSNIKKSDMLDKITKFVISAEYDAVISYKFVCVHLEKTVPTNTDVPIETMSFGNTVGSNRLNNKKKILIIGTPFPDISTFNFLMKVKYSNFEIIDFEDEFEKRKVRYNNCDFSVFVPVSMKSEYIDDYCEYIYNELNQSIGRIRPLSNLNSELHIMSNFILDKSIVDEYDDEFEI